jgi:hypothetical protein
MRCLSCSRSSLDLASTQRRAEGASARGEVVTLALVVRDGLPGRRQIPANEEILGVSELPAFVDDQERR